MQRYKVLVLLMTLAACSQQDQDAASKEATREPQSVSGTTRLPGLSQLTLAPVVERVTPAVVNISVAQRSPLAENPLLRDPFFRRFFDVPDAALAPVLSGGSGVIVDAERGLVVTNNHVIDGAQRIEVSLRDNRRVAAELVGTDPATDIAVLKIAARDLAALPFGDSDKMRIGDYVVAIGDPFGLGQTVTAGIVSAKGRGGIIPGGYEDFVQTDAPINPGNSGGALVNMAGQLIGINTALFGPSGANVGIGFAVSSNMARAVMDQIVEHGEVRRGAIGALITGLPAELSNAGNADAPREGALVAGVLADSPAEEAGLKRGDVVVQIGDRDVRSASDLRTRIGLAPVGSTLQLGVLRNGEKLRIAVNVEAQPKQRPEAAFGSLGRYRD